MWKGLYLVSAHTLWNRPFFINMCMTCDHQCFYFTEHSTLPKIQFFSYYPRQLDYCQIWKNWANISLLTCIGWFFILSFSLQYSICWLGYFQLFSTFFFNREGLYGDCWHSAQSCIWPCHGSWSCNCCLITSFCTDILAFILENLGKWQFRE